jgi:hypothetical protein
MQYIETTLEIAWKSLVRLAVFELKFITLANKIPTIRC